MPTSQARVATVNGSRYLQQLCKHWSHRFAVEFNEQAGSVDFGEGKIFTASADDAGVTLRVQADDPAADIGGLEQVVESHFKRFAFREELEMSWKRG